MHLLRLPLLLVLFCLCHSARSATHQELGLGLHYYRVLEDIEVDSFESSGSAYVLAYRYDGGLLSLQAELELFPEDFVGADSEVYAVQAMLLVGDGLYAGLGVGTFYAQDDFSENEFYFVRVGLSLFSLGPVTVELNANYTFSDFSDLEGVGDNADSDTITLGAMVRIAL